MISELQWMRMFSEELQYHMKKQNISQRELANKARLTEATISRYIHCERLPSISSIIKLAFALEVGVEELIDFGYEIE